MSVSETRLVRSKKWLRKGYSDIPGVSGTSVPAGSNLVDTIASGINGQTFVLEADASNPYRIDAPLSLKSGQTLFSSNGAVIKGSVIASNWTYNGNGRWYTTGLLPTTYDSTNGSSSPTPPNGGWCNIVLGSEANPCHFFEDVFFDGTQLRRYMRLESLTASGFYQDYVTNRVYIARDPANHVIEIESTPFAIAEKSGVDNCRISGITFMHFSSPSQRAAVTVSGNNWEIDHCNFIYNHALGLRLSYANDTHIHNNTITHNSQMGMGAYMTKRAIIENNEIAYNNHMADYYALDWESGAIKFTVTNDCIFRNNHSHHNSGIGIWADGANIGLTYDNNIVEDNEADGIRHEISFGAIIKNNIIRRNGLGATSGKWREPNPATPPNSTTGLFAPHGEPFMGAGININCSGGWIGDSMETIEIHHNIVEDNQNGIFLQQRDREQMISRATLTQNVHVYDNAVRMTGHEGDIWGWGVSGMGQLGYPTGDSRTADTFFTSAGNWFRNNTYTLDSFNAVRFAHYEPDTGNATRTTYGSFSTYQAKPGFDTEKSILTRRPGSRVSLDSDDGYWSTADGTSTFSTDSIIVGDYDATRYGRCGWIRLKVDIPAGTTIDSAVLDVNVTGNSGDSPSIIIAADKSLNSAQPSSATDISLRSRTNASVDWGQTVSYWSSNYNKWVSTPSVKSIIQELISQPGWTSGNYATFLFITDSTTFSSMKQISLATMENDASGNLAGGLIATWH